MPILALEPDIYPQELLGDEPLDATGEWWVLYTMSRREKQLARVLHTAEVSFYAPLVKRTTCSPAGRVRHSYVPLFPGYVFLRGDDEQRRMALASNCVSRTLAVNNARGLVSDLRNIRRLLELGLPLESESQLTPGRTVRVRSGALAGLEGTVLHRRGQQRLLVAVNFLQQGVSMQIDDFAVERTD